jgi:hypothetical protein
MKLDICMVERGTPNTQLFHVDWPAVPAVGSYIASNRRGQVFNGYVIGVQFYQDEDGTLTIEVRIQ